MVDEPKLDYADTPPRAPGAGPGRSVRTWVILLLVWAVGLIVWMIYLAAILYVLYQVF